MNNTLEQDLKLQFPTILRNKNKTNEFVGVLRSVDNEPILVTFTAPNYPSARNATIEIGNYLNDKIISSLVSKSEKLNFLEFLKLVHNKILSMPKKKKFNSSSFSRFSHEFRQLRQNNPFDKFVFDEKAATLKIGHVDDFGVMKEILVRIDLFSHGLMYQVIKHNFPGEVANLLYHSQASLLVIYKLFLEFVKKLSAFHETLHKIDLMCWVTAPPDKGFEHHYRTIVIADNNISVKLSFDPWSMSRIPEFRFFGPSNMILKYTSILSENLNNWDPCKDIIQNLLSVLDLPFMPLKPEEEVNAAPSGDIVLYDSDTECSICFSYHLNEQSPDIVCNNDSCKRHFHNECIYEWLSLLPNSVVIFGSLTGKCPNCEKIITFQVPETNK